MKTEKILVFFILCFYVLGVISGIEVPMQSDGTTTISSVTYNIWKSKNTYSGTFNVQLF